ncbi:MAG: hypothetical protein K8R54_19650 [Bacteroidales bacterium]|nr:hypothetical protein [Bacteroidales bacterium]
MKKSKGYNIEELPLKNLKKVADLIEFEGPILSLFKDEKQNYFLFYWVDQDNILNRWLIWKIDIPQLKHYINGIISLYEVINSPTKDYIFQVDIDGELNYRNIKFIDIKDISEDYLPEIESFYDTDFLPQIQELIDLKEKIFYLESLRKKSLYFTLKPTTSVFSTTISVVEAGNFLRDISSSFLSFVEFDFFESFKEIITDVKKINRTILRIKEILTLRVVHLKYSSFEVALATDTVQKIESKEISEWRNQVLDKYKVDVINLDYDSENHINKMINKYPSQTRHKIYTPIINIINNKNYSTNVSDHYKRTVRSLKKINKKNKELLIPKSQESGKKEETSKKLINLIIEIDGNTDIGKIGKRELHDNLLFSEEISEYIIKMDKIETSEYTIELKESINLKILYEDASYKIADNEYGIGCEAETSEEAINSFKEKFINFYKFFINDNSEENIIIKRKLNRIVQKIIKK